MKCASLPEHSLIPDTDIAHAHARTRLCDWLYKLLVNISRPHSASALRAASTVLVFRITYARSEKMNVHCLLVN